jgi:hypothetical protein
MFWLSEIFNLDSIIQGIKHLPPTSLLSENMKIRSSLFMKAKRIQVDRDPFISTPQVHSMSKLQRDFNVYHQTLLLHFVHRDISAKFKNTWVKSS